MVHEPHEDSPSLAIRQSTNLAVGLDPWGPGVSTGHGAEERAKGGMNVECGERYMSCLSRRVINILEPNPGGHAGRCGVKLPECCDE